MRNANRIDTLWLRPIDLMHPMSVINPAEASAGSEWFKLLLRGSEEVALMRWLLKTAETSFIALDDAALAALGEHLKQRPLPPRIVPQRRLPAALRAEPTIRRILVLDTRNEERARARLMQRMNESVLSSHADRYQFGTFVADLLPLAIARRPVTELSFGPAPDIADVVLYAVAAAPRSGSTFLSDLLHSTGLANPIEHIRPWLVASFAARPADLFDSVRFTQRLIAAGRSGSVFGTKLIPSVLAGMRKGLTPAETTYFGELAARTTIVYLNRSDKLRQAISWLRARKTGIYHSTSRLYKGPDQYESFSYDFDEIARAVKRSLGEEKRLVQLIKDHPRLIVVDYDELTASPEGICQKIATQLGVPIQGTPTARISKLADGASEELARRFLRDATERGVAIEATLPTKDLLEPAQGAADRSTPVVAKHTGKDVMSYDSARFRDRNEAEHDALISANRFVPVVLNDRAILNSLPKSGTVLLRNVLLHFFGTEASEPATLEPKDIENFSSFESLLPNGKKFVTAHFPLYPQSSAFVRSMATARMLLLIRDALENSYSLARHLMRPGQHRFNDLSKYIKDTNAPLEEVVYYCIRGYGMGKGSVEGVIKRYMHYIAWVSLGAKLIKYEDLMRAGTDLGSGFSEEFFRGIANFLKFELPGDWPQRVAEAFAPEKSWTFAHIDPGVEKFPEREFFLDLLRAEAGPLLKFLGYDRTS